MEQLRWLFVEAFVLAFLMVYFLLPKACRIGLVDWPKARKRHTRSVPLIGGLAIFFTYVIVRGTAGIDGTQFLLLVAGCGLLVLVGALDDYFDFPPWPRMAAQVMAGLFMPAAGVVLTDIGTIGPSGELVPLGVLAIPFTVFATVGMINAFNMSDGIDGLSGCLSLVALVSLVVIATVAGRPDAAASLVVLAGSIAGFLAYNLRTPLRRKAAVFLGDAGSMLLGFALTWFLISLSQSETRAMAPVCALWLVALPLIDTVYSIMRRAAARQSPLSPDTRHLHHLLLKAGLSVGQTVVVLVLVAGALAGIGVAGAILDWPQFALGVGFASLFVCYCVGVSATWRLLEHSEQQPPPTATAERSELAPRARTGLPPMPTQSTAREGLIAEKSRISR